MSSLKWFLDRLKQPSYVDRVSDDEIEPVEELDSIVPPQPMPAQDPRNKPLNPAAVNDMASQMWGEGFDKLENSQGVGNPGTERFPLSNKLKYQNRMRKKTEEEGLEPLPPLSGGALSGY